MFLAEHESGSLYVAEILLWSLPVLLGARLAYRSGPGSRAAWILVAGACLVIVLDKAIDLQAPFHRSGQALVYWLDPATHFRGPGVVYRVLLLGGLFLVGCLAIFFFLRRDRSLDRAKLVSLAGIVLVMAYLGTRLLPGPSEFFVQPRGWLVEGLCYALVILGELLGLRHLRISGSDAGP